MAITDFHFVQNKICTAGFILLDQDLNEGADGKYDYLLIKQGEDGSKETDIEFRSYGDPLPTTSRLVDWWRLFHKNLNDEPRAKDRLSICSTRNSDVICIYLQYIIKILLSN